MSYIVALRNILFTSCLLLSSWAYASPAEKEVLTNGWYYWDPYQYNLRDPKTDELTGLDIELTRAITKLAGKSLEYKSIDWQQHQKDLASGKIDFVSGATKAPEREKLYHFSKPYRYEENAYFVRRGEESNLTFTSIAEFLNELSVNKQKIGVIEGYVYADSAINKWIADPKNRDFILPVSDDAKNIQNLIEKKIDGFLADRIAGATQIWRNHQGDQITEIKLGIQTPIHFMFSKTSVSPSIVHEFNLAIDRLQSSDQYQNIITWYLHPVLLLQTIDTQWFRIIEILGTIAFAISGLVIAVRDRSTLFGAFIFALLPSLGGGMIRDIIFDRKPLGAMASPTLLLIVIGTVLFGFASIRLVNYIQKYYDLNIFKEKGAATAQTVLMFCDGLGLAAFTVIGIVVSVMAKVSPLWLWGAFFAFLTGAGGGILRDLLSKNRHIVSLQGDIYPEIAIVWGMILALFLSTQAQTINPDPIRYMVFITVIGAFITRVLVYYFKVPNIYFTKKDTL
ncbi:MAG: transporter substrate-binding domain-containing protein [Alphaproteobacteria bacterium]|nr:transporter substrate-binding domain-containing protein [Alphaproteobacteria bacterium]